MKRCWHCRRYYSKTQSFPSLMICGKFVRYKSNTAEPEGDEDEGESVGPFIGQQVLILFPIYVFHLISQLHSNSVPPTLHLFQTEVPIHGATASRMRAEAASVASVYDPPRLSQYKMHAFILLTWPSCSTSSSLLSVTWLKYIDVFGTICQNKKSLILMVQLWSEEKTCYREQRQMRFCCSFL